MEGELGEEPAVCNKQRYEQGRRSEADEKEKKAVVKEAGERGYSCVLPVLSSSGAKPLLSAFSRGDVGHLMMQSANYISQVNNIQRKGLFPTYCPTTLLSVVWLGFAITVCVRVCVFMYAQFNHVDPQVVNDSHLPAA